MQKKLIARTAKLSSESKKSRHFKGIAITYEHIPKDLDERNHGSIYAVINIDADTDCAQEITEIIIDAFHGEFYQDLNKDPLASLEDALTKINEELADVTHQGKIGWLNHLNAVLAVLSGTTFHLTQAGKTEAFLYRGEKSSHVSEDLAGDSTNPLRTFINIASGNLVEGDKISIVTPGVFFHISKDELKKYVQGFQPRVAISHIADLIEGTTTEMKPNAVLILEAITPEAASNETLDEQPDEVWISEPSRPLETAFDNAKPVIRKTGNILTTVFATAAAFTKERAVPYIKETSADAYESIQRWQKKRAKVKSFKENVLVDTEESLSKRPTTVIETDEFEPELISEKETAVATKKPNEIYIKEEQRERVKWLKLEKVDFSAAKNLSTKFRKQTGKMAKNRGMLLAVSALAFVLVIGGGYMMWQKRVSAENLKSAQTSLSEAQTKYDLAMSALDAGERKTAVDGLNETLAITEKIKSNKLIAADALALYEKAKSAIDQAENVQRLSDAAFADASNIIGASSIGPFAIGKNLYLVGEDGTVAAINVENGEASNVLDKPTITGKVVAATAVTSRRVLAIMTDQAIYEFDTVALTMKKQESSGEIENAKSMAAFSTNIYSLDAENGKVYKRTKITGGYGRRSEYITDGTSVTGAKSIAIDSSLYVLGNDGTISKFLSGKKKDYSLSDLPFEFGSASLIFTDEETSGLYIVDTNKKLVARFDADGKYLGGFSSDNFGNITGVFVNDSTNTGYVNAGGKIFKLSL